MFSFTKGMFSYKGRLDRKSFIKIHIILFIIIYPLLSLYLKGHFRDQTSSIIVAGILLFLWVISAFACIKRLQDFNYPGYWAIVAYMVCLVLSQYFGYRPLLIFICFISVLKPSPAENYFGDNPLGNSSDIEEKISIHGKRKVKVNKKHRK